MADAGNIVHGQMDIFMFSVRELLVELGGAANPTDVAARSGNWSDAATWQSGHVPGVDAVVSVPVGINVQVDAVLDPVLKAIIVSGQLSFRSDVNTGVTVDTVFVDGGTLQIGTPQAPIAPTVTAFIRFPTTAPAFPTAIDPRLVTRGILSDGTLVMNGAAKTSRATLVGDIATGTTALSLDRAPTGWNAGDTLVVPATRFTLDFAPAENELIPVTSLTGTAIGLGTATQFAHMRPTVDPAAVASTSAPAMKNFVANLTRNIVIQSMATDTPNRGHVMQMTNDVQISGVQFKDLGRTDKRHPVADPTLGADGVIIPGKNPRARYAFHVHVAGCSGATVAAGHEGTISDSVMWGSPGWGFVNHASYLQFADNVAYDYVGAGFVTEDGSEAGEFLRNMAIGGRSTGNGENSLPESDTSVPPESMKAFREVFGDDSRLKPGDMGFGGHGFWFQGADIGVQDNVSAGNKGAGFEFWANGKYDPGAVAYTSFPSDRVPATAAYKPRRFADGSVVINSVPLRSFTGNQSYGNFIGVKARFTNGFGGVPMDVVFPNSFTMTKVPVGGEVLGNARIERLTVWSNRIGIVPSYTHMSFSDVLDVAPADDSAAIADNPPAYQPEAALWTTGPRSLTFDRFTMVNYHVGTFFNGGATGAPPAEKSLPAGITSFNVATPYANSVCKIDCILP